MSQQGRHAKPSSDDRPVRRRAPAPETPEPDTALPDELPPETAEAPAGEEKPRPAAGTVKKKKKKRPASAQAARGTAVRAGTSGGRKRKKRRKKKKKTLLTVLLVLLGILLVLGIAGYAVFHHLYGVMGTGGVNAATTPEPAVTATPYEEEEPSTPEPTETPEPTPVPLTEEELAELAELELRANLEEEAEEIAYSDDVYNMLLIGADGTSDQIERGDAMLIVSINRRTKQIWITSLMRDTQVSLYTEQGTFYSTGHLNWAVQWGGIGMLRATVESTRNYAIKIDNYALVNFVDFAEIASMLGPITVTLNEREVASANKLITQVCQMRDKAYGLKKPNLTPRVYFPKEGGTFEISDGIQILAYCRERGGGIGTNHYGDTGRSFKQREVLKKMWQNVQNMTLRQQYEVLEKIMSVVTTDMTEGRCFQMLLSAPTLLTYDVKTQQSPALETKVSTRDANGYAIYLADWNTTRNLLRATIYGEEMSRRQLTSSLTGQYAGGVLEQDE